MEKQYKFKAWQPFEGYQTIAITDEFEAIMWGLEHQVDIFTQEDKLVYSPNDDEESNFERLAKYSVCCIEDASGRRWERIEISNEASVELKHTFVIRTDDATFEQALIEFLSTHCTKETQVNVAYYELNEIGAKKVMDIVFEK